MSDRGLGISVLTTGLLVPCFTIPWKLKYTGPETYSDVWSGGKKCPSRLPRSVLLVTSGVRMGGVDFRTDGGAGL